MVNKQPMNKSRNAHAITLFKGNVFVLGGFSCKHRLNSVKNTWFRRTSGFKSPNQRQAPLLICVLDRRLGFMGAHPALETFEFIRIVRTLTDFCTKARTCRGAFWFDSPEMALWQCNLEVFLGSSHRLLTAILCATITDRYDKCFPWLGLSSHES